MEETVYLFCSRKQFTTWIAENCGKCRVQSAGFPGCRLSAAMADAPFPEGVVPLSLAERVGYFDADIAGRPGSPGSWTCRQFREKAGPPAGPFPAGD